MGRSLVGTAGNGFAEGAGAAAVSHADGASVTAPACVPAGLVKENVRPQTRIAALDLGRFLAAFGIVWAHAGAPGAQAGYTALGLFLVMTGYLAVGSYQRAPGPGFWAARARRILVPWLIWCVIFRVLHDVVGHNPFRLLSEPFSLLIGPAIHLWFLPAAMLALLFVPGLARDIVSRAALIRATAGLVVLSALLVAVQTGAGPLDGHLLPEPFPQWSFSLPIYLWGVLHALALRLGAGRLTLAGAVLASAASWAVVPGLASVQMILSALAFEALRRLPLHGSSARGALWLGSHAFGIYLMHPFFTLLAYKFLGPDLPKALLALVSFGGAFFATAVLLQLPLARRLA